MFDDKTVGHSTFNSQWRRERNSVDCGTGTNFNLTLKDVSSQTTNNLEKQVQASHETSTSNSVAYSEENLAAFLAKAVKVVLEALNDEDSISQCLSNPILEENDRNFEKLCTLKGTSVMQVSSITWSCDEKVIAVGYRCHHENWCRHTGTINLFNFDEPSHQRFSVTQPIQNLNLKNCVSSLSFHPRERFILAAGTVSGDVYLWTLKKGVTKNEVFSMHHSDCITQISWFLNPSNMKFMLASSSKDGYIILWDVSTQSNSVKPKLRFSFKNASNLEIDMEVRCFVFAPQQADIFVTALMNGKLCKCSVSASRPLPQIKGQKFTHHDAVIDTFKTYSSNPVISMDFLKTEENLLVVAFADQKCIIYSISNVEPLNIIFSDQDICGVRWCQADRQHFLAWGDDSITFHNTKTDSSTLTLEPFQNEREKTAVNFVCFNPNSPHCAAIGSADGNIAVWKIPMKLNEANNFEIS